MSILSTFLSLWRKQPFEQEFRINDEDLETPIEPSLQATPEERHRLLEQAEVSLRRDLQQLRGLIQQGFIARTGNDSFVTPRVIQQIRPKIIALKGESLYLKDLASRTKREDLRQELNHNWPLVYAAAARMMRYLEATQAGELTLAQLSEQLLWEADEIERVAGWG